MNKTNLIRECFKNQKQPKNSLDAFAIFNEKNKNVFDLKLFQSTYNRLIRTKDIKFLEEQEIKKTEIKNEEMEKIIYEKIENNEISINEIVDEINKSDLKLLKKQSMANKLNKRFQNYNIKINEKGFVSFEGPFLNVGFVKYFSTPSKDIQYIPYNKVNNLDPEKLKDGFNELLIKPEFVRIYFDFDHIETLEAYEQIINWLNEISKIAGNYSIGGYTNNEELFGNLYKFIPGATKTLSLHVIYYETKIKASKLVEFMRFEQNKFIYSKVNENCDYNVYKLNTEQKFRHVYSNKTYGLRDPRNLQIAGSFLNNTPISNSLIQINGTERELNDEELKNIFGEKLNETEETEEDLGFANQEETEEIELLDKPKKQKKEKKEKKIILPDHIKEQLEKIEDDKERERKTREAIKAIKEDVKKFNIDSVDFDDKLIIMSKDELIELLHNFNNGLGTCATELIPLYSSPYSKEFLIETIKEWWLEKEDHDNEFDKTEKIINKYYKYEKNNRWFYCLIKHFKEEIRNQYIKKYKNSIDFSITLNNSKITYNNIKYKSYDVFNLKELIEDLRGCVGVIDEKWYVKVDYEDQTKIEVLTYEQISHKFRTFKPFLHNNTINLFQFVSKLSNFFMYKSAVFQKESKDNEINLFQGFKYNEIETNDFSIIQPFLNHIENVICNKDPKKYDYLMKWYANIFQNITVKNGTMPIIIGSQGSGKSFAAEIFTELLGIHGLPNVDDLEKIFGKFNGLVNEQTILININEPPNAEDRTKFEGSIKSKLTQLNQNTERKGIDPVSNKIWSNFVLTTNNYTTIKEEKGNRRIIYFEVNNEYSGNLEYFEKLCKPIQPQKQGNYNKYFMGVLLHYMKTKIDVSDFNPEKLIFEMNENTELNYNPQLERQYLDLNLVFRYVVEHYKEFICWKDLDSFDAEIEGYKKIGIAKKIREICDNERRQESKTRKQYFKLKPLKDIRDLWNIIKYINKNYKEEIKEMRETKEKELEELKKEKETKETELKEIKEKELKEIKEKELKELTEKQTRKENDIMTIKEFEN